MTKKKYFLSYIIITIFFLLFFLLKLKTFLNVDLRVDQAHYANWINSLKYSHGITIHSELSNLLTENNNFFFQLGIRIYNDLFRVFNLIDLFFFFPSFLIFNDGWKAFNFSSIFFSSLVSLSLVLFILSLSNLRAKKLLKKILIIFTVCLVLFSQHYLFYASFLGFHLLGVLFNLLTLLLLNKFFFCKEKKKNIFYLIFSFVLAFYSHWTNIILLSITLIIYILFFFQSKFQEKILKIFFFFLTFTFLLIPFFLLLFYIQREKNFDLFFYAGFSNFYFFDLFFKSVEWFSKIINILTLPYFILGLVGSYYLIKKYPFLLSAILAHFFASIFIPGFLDYSLRTFLYIVPVFLICVFYFLTINLKNYLLSCFVWVILFSGLFFNIFLISNLKFFSSYNNSFYKEYLLDNNLKNDVIKVRDNFKKENIIFYDYYARDLFCSYSYIDECLKPALSTLLERKKVVNFEIYLKKRNLNLDSFFGSDGIIISTRYINPEEKLLIKNQFYDLVVENYDHLDFSNKIYISFYKKN
jgi:hypothetical protein